VSSDGFHAGYDASMTRMEPTPPLPESQAPAALPDSNTRLARALALALLAALIV
jgi:hypothetical protein